MYRQLQGSSYLFAGNAPFIEELYETYLSDPAQVPEPWRGYFDQLQQTGAARDVSHARIREAFVRLARENHGAARAGTVTNVSDVERKQVHVLQLINAHRFLGVRHANLDPLQRQEPAPVVELDPAHYGLGDDDMDSVFNTGSFVGPAQAPLRDIVAALRNTYCGSVGLEYMHIAEVAQKRWIQARFEAIQSTPSFSADEKRHILGRLTAAETFEKYLHTRYVGQKRFSLEGGESVMVALDHLVRHAAALSVQELVIGMAHRGRLNVLVNLLGKPPILLFEEFEGKHDAAGERAGDVKYHQGYSRDVATPSGPIHLTLGFNPSHLEIVDPVIEGATRARQQRRGDRQGKLAIPVLLHGDAAFAGQGVVMETLNLSQTRGFGTGGTVHIIVNNQIGFTTSDPRDTRSTLYCTDVAKMVDAPVFHVNGDDPEAVALVTQAALDFRMTFGKDVVVDVLCFRRLGHNEQDEPMVTQPLMYKKINAHPGTRRRYADRLVQEGVLAPSDPERMVNEYRVVLDGGGSLIKTMPTDYKRMYAVDWKPFRNTSWTQAARTGVPADTLRFLTARLTAVPPGFKLHPTVDKIMAARRDMGAGKLPLDWGMAENLAYAALLNDGYGIRLSGQDSGRGTFFHRHAVLHDQNRERWDEGVYVPLQHLKDNQPNFLVVDSLLSEEAVLAFEYGYAAAEPNELVIWEAQFGDFANGAQVVIDQFIASSETKWGVQAALVMMLPHGIEGQGPEHSSGRLERYLQLCAEYNLQVCVPSLPAQMFHLLRRQLIRPYRKPLVIFSPKSLLRHKESVSPLADLVDGAFRPVIGEVEDLDPKAVERVVLCAGKLYFELARARRERGIRNIAIVRIEQLYPFPHDDFRTELRRYPNATEVMWAQEEPKNQGAWYWIQHYLRDHMTVQQALCHSSRASSAVPAGGYLDVFVERQRALIDRALSLAPEGAVPEEKE